MFSNVTKEVKGLLTDCFWWFVSAQWVRVLWNNHFGYFWRGWSIRNEGGLHWAGFNYPIWVLIHRWRWRRCSSKSAKSHLHQAVLTHPEKLWELFTPEEKEGDFLLVNLDNFSRIVCATVRSGLRGVVFSLATSDRRMMDSESRWNMIFFKVLEIGVYPWGKFWYGSLRKI